MPPALDELLGAMLAKDPSARPASAAAAAVKLRTIAEDLRRAADRLTHKVQHRTEPTPLANMMVTTRAPGSEPRLETNDTTPGGYVGDDANTTEPGAPPFEDVQSDTSPMNGTPFASTKPSRRAGVDRNAETRLRDATPPQLSPRFDTDPMTGRRAKAGEPPAAAETPFTSTAGVVSSRTPVATQSTTTKRTTPLLAGAVIAVVAVLGMGALATRYATSSPRAPAAATPHMPIAAATIPASSAQASAEPTPPPQRSASPSAAASTASSSSPKPQASGVPSPRPRAAPRSSAATPSAIGFE